MAVVAGILANGVTEILKKLSSVVVNEITLVWDFNDELKNLQNTMNMILDVMEDAEKKQLSQAAVRRWMEELKAIAYDAEDILDDYSYEVNLCKHKKEEFKSTVFNKVRNKFSSSKPSFKVIRKLAHQIKEINERFKIIEDRKNKLGLLTIDLGSSSSSLDMIMMKNRETYSFVPKDWKIVGRENEKSTIIKMLLEEEEEKSTNEGDGGKHISVIPIVGMGGLGKTTMAQLVYNDEAVKRHFDIKVWICVSDPFDVKKLFKNIAKSLDEKAICDDVTTMENIICGFQKHLRGKKFLLVLDDVWNENHADWYKLRTPLMVGAQGSKIMITTRSVEVALIMQDNFLPYSLGILDEKDCWSLFKERAFGSAAGAKETPNLVEIGQEMVNRCKGLPLAVIFLGCLMRSKKKEDEWKIIRDTKLWHESRDGKKSKNEILPSLRLSYDYLPSHLKLCFSYCCLFPKDYMFNRKTLIGLWMAEGFLVETPEENKMWMEEIGKDYFDSLLSSFFFQEVMKDDDGNVFFCKMHDLVHDLARSVVGNHECLIVENALDIDYISEETRRLNLLVDLDDKEMLPKVLEALKKATKLRTIFVNKQRIDFDIGNAFKENKRVRVLDMSGSDVTTESISSSIGGLKHLRYLDVHGACFPKGIGRLSFLQTLSEFNVGDKVEDKNAACGIEELEGLNLLTGDLSINHLRNVTSGTDACRANLKEKKNLRGLSLSWEGPEGGDAAWEGDAEKKNLPGLCLSWEGDAKNAEAVLEGLRPHPNLRVLVINGFQVSKLPRWIEDSSCLPNLVSLRLLYCGMLLRSLTLRSTASTCFPLLEEITIWSCPLLSTITPTSTTIFPSLKVLDLRDIDGSAARTLINNLNSLTSLTLIKIDNLISLPRQGLMENNNTLLSLHIEDCIQFEGFRDEDDDDEDVFSSSCSSSSSSSSLQSLTLRGCPAMRYYLNIRSLTSLRTLEIQECKESKSLQDELTCLSSSSSSSSSSLLEHLEHVKILKENTTSLKEVVVFEWSKLSVSTGIILMWNRATIMVIPSEQAVHNLGYGSGKRWHF